MLKNSNLARQLAPCLLTVAVLAACNESVGPVSEEMIDQDIALLVASSTGDDIEMMTTQSAPVTSAIFGAGCSKEGMRFRCPRQRHGDAMFDRVVTFFDETGTEQAAYDDLTTESIHILTTRSIDRSRDRFTFTAESMRDVTISGLLGSETERTWNGTGTTSRNRTRVSDDNGLRTYDMTSSVEIVDVVVPVPHDSGYPLSGTMTRTISVTIVNGSNDPRVRDRVVIIEFNGTQFVPMTINGEAYTLDLETRRPVRD